MKHANIQFWDDERDAGNSLIVTLKPSFRFGERGEHVRGFDTSTVAMKEVKGAVQCDCQDCQSVLDAANFGNSQYKTLDGLILERLSGGKRANLTQITHSGACHTECHRIGTATGRQPYRILDGRLQALKQQGKIRFTGKDGWEIVK